MYEEFFKFHGRPFVSAPQTKTYFPAAVIENARQTLTRLIARGEGPGLIIGPPGTGKTLLCQLLAEQFRDQFAVAVLSCGRLKTSQAMLQAVLYEMGLPCRGVDEGELRLSLMDYLEPKPEGRAGLLLLVDEAHTLSWRLLDEVRMLTNLVRAGQPRVRVVLAGGRVLEERFASPKLESFSQRLAGRCYLEPLDSVETAGYVRAQIAAAGGDAASLIDEEALRSVHRASDGVPRLINQVCDHALILAQLGGHRQLTSEAIDEAWADLQQLPPPWTPGAADDASSQVVEFGKLDDDRSEFPDAIPFRGVEERQQPGPLLAGAPEEQLEAIANQLSTIDSGVPSAAEQSTEADLDFPEFGDPFTERFAEEEVVVENYTSDIEIFADVPRVSSWEGQQLGSLLEEIDTEPWTQGSPRANVRLSEACTEEAMPTGPITESTAWAFSPASDPVLPEESTAEPLPAVASPAPPSAHAHAAATAQSQSLDKLAGAANDRDLIVVEDDVSGTPSGVLQPPAQARKGEFRQLFAKLRRG
jgi:type II secretory pathway predicted ATPase ExeA